MPEDLSEIIKTSKKIVFCGIGNSLRGDDAFGIIVARRLEKNIHTRDILVLDCGETPEMFLDKIAGFNPDTIIFIDAVDFGGNHGDLIITDPHSTLGNTLSTHNLPLKLLWLYLKERLGNANMYLIGVQPAETSLGSKPSRKIVERAFRLSDYLSSLLSSGSST